EREVALAAAEPPDDRARPAVDLVDGRRVPRRDDQVAAGVDADRVQVEVVAVRLRDEAVAIRLAEPDVVAPVPLEQHLLRRDVDLLDDALDELAGGGAAHGGEIPG